MAAVLRPLIEAAQEGDREALNELALCAGRFIRMFSGSLPRLIRRTHGSTTDFVYEGLAEAFADLKDFDYRSDEEFYGWIARTIHNRVADAWRRENADKRAGRPISLDRDGVQAASDETTASGVFARQELREEVGRNILELQVEHPEAMEVVVLKVFEGMSWPQIRELRAYNSDRRARTLFAQGIDLLRPRVEKVLGDTALDKILEAEQRPR